MNLLESAFLLLMHTLFPMLRLAPGDSFPRPLSREKEQEALARWAEGDLEARNLLVEHNLRLVAHIVKKYYQAEDADDLISIGTIGLIKGINTYRADKGVRLATYASRCIENEVLMHLRHTARSRRDISLDEPLRRDWDGNELLLSDVLGTESDLVYRRMDDKVEKQLLRAALDRLPGREKQIMQLRFGLGGAQEMTQKEVADRLGISQSYISRLEKRILARLNTELTRLSS